MRLHDASLARRRRHPGMDSGLDDDYSDDSVTVGGRNGDRRGFGFDDYGVQPSRRSMQGGPPGGRGPRSRHLNDLMDDMHLHPQGRRAGGTSMSHHDGHHYPEMHREMRPQVVDMSSNPRQRHGEGRETPHTWGDSTEGYGRPHRSLPCLRQERRDLEQRRGYLIDSRMDTGGVESRINTITREIGRHQEADEEFDEVPDIFDYDNEESGFPPHGSRFSHYEPPGGYYLAH